MRVTVVLSKKDACHLVGCTSYEGSCMTTIKFMEKLRKELRKRVKRV